MGAYLVLMQQVDDADRYPPADTAAAWNFHNDPDHQPVKDIRFGVTSRGQMVVAPEFRPAG